MTVAEAEARVGPVVAGRGFNKQNPSAYPPLQLDPSEQSPNMTEAVITATVMEIKTFNY